MPYYRKRRSTRRYGRKYSSRRKPFRRRSSRYSKQLAKTPDTPLNNRFKSTMLYNEVTQLNPGVGTMSVQVMSANGLYDPDISGTGHQPRGFDQIMPLFDHYTVIGAEIRVDFSSTESSLATQVGVSLVDDGTLSSAASDYIENGNTKYIYLAPRGSGGSTASLTMKVNPNKFLGRSKPLADPDLKGNIGSNPSEQAFFHIWAIGAGGSDTATVSTNITVKYIAIFTEPKRVSQS